MRIVATCFSFGTRIVYFSRAPGDDSAGTILMCANASCADSRVNATPNTALFISISLSDANFVSRTCYFWLFTSDFFVTHS